MEISRRCQACGAAIRGQADFCPQCGEPMRRTTNPEPAVVRQESRESGDGNLNIEESAELASPASLAEDSASGFEEGREVSNIGASVENRPRVKVYTEPEVERGNKRRRMSNAARGAMEDKLMPRVEKMRQSSAVMLDEAAIDPSLRFVLIAAALFAIFVVLLFISLLR